MFLQGSYANDTNIYAESDVDLVIRLDDCFQSDLSELTEEEMAAYRSTFPDAIYTYVDFKQDVLTTLKKQYGAAVTTGDKAIAIGSSGTRRKADVIVAIQLRRYFKFRSSYDSEYAEGICFWNGNGERIVNYRKQHSANLTTKHPNTSRWFKQMARVFKNMRSRLVDDGLIESRIVPSYYIEGLLYNVPNANFLSSYQACVVNTLNWYRQGASKADLLCANEHYYLLRDGHFTCWNQSHCDAFVDAAVTLWNEW